MKLLIRFLGLVLAIYLFIGVLQRIFGHYHGWVSPLVLLRQNFVAIATAGLLLLDARKKRARGEAIVYVAGLMIVAVWYSIEFAWSLRSLGHMWFVGATYIGHVVSLLAVFILWATVWLAMTQQKFA